ncbi:hypothetical protein OG840_19075 [Streptomyces sp. NBC_01764]|uniref:hypothetical protein n=1 Tax=Streptomyces sp. NBC_01764 TaxID=2975935 RepID=UPI0022532720|nr:hypothetical protein [Streptomyces sp. NBC_01764]MCX4403818.1 hypothetical protein [Streptomyces sp. NBC_01764]
MKFSAPKSVAAAFTATAILAGSVMAVGASAASADSAADNIGFLYVASLQDFNVYINNRVVGGTEWQANGDTLVAKDIRSDGYRIEAYLGTSPVRKASTAGHNAPYAAKVGGNLPENRIYTYWACVAKSGSSLICSDVHRVES